MILENAHPHSGSLSTWSNWNWETVFEEGENQRKTSQSKRENQQQTQPTYGINNAFQTRATSVGGRCSHQLWPLCLTTLPPLPPSSCSLTWEFWSLKVSFLLQMMEIGFILLNGKEQQKNLHGKGWGFFMLNQ